MSEIKYLSTTALAKTLDKEPKEVFILLAQAHWMIKVDGGWQLTEKGRFEGGVYLNHPKFGDYVAWPETVLTHGLWRSLPEAPLSASQLGAKLGMPARLLNLVLRDLGWQIQGLKGWLLTSEGRARGGQQHRAEESAIPYVTWPEKLEQDEALKQVVRALTSGVGIDGRNYATPAEGRLGGWLYLQGLSFSYRRQMEAGPAPVLFYLPAGLVYLHGWATVASAQALTQKLAMETWLKSKSCVFIDFERCDSIEEIDRWLPGTLLQQGVSTY
ncbi:4-alpha-glucanotransferase [Simiduia curdlanivorans]|uniref:4-alpha-glucanotransferase n=1 Tax=Simiduia curdlanivorans TaxID=1492769 RepID=A0ABV8VBA5_9GAMM|nr:4-alpha-glucanotransferase [Simiduia curdlanivorans]MDN3639685.1 4-alpha-glucanotransferase [Simiduia curdlanivorans]